MEINGRFVVHFKIADTFCAVDDSIFKFHVSTDKDDIVAIFNTCQSNCVLLLSLLFFVPAFLIKLRKACKSDDAPLAYMPLLRMSNSLTSRFHNTGDSSFFGSRRLRSSEYYLLLLINSITCISWIFMSYGHIFGNHKVMKNNPMSISKFTVLLSQVIQWMVAIIYLKHLRGKGYSPTFKFLKTFYIIQCLLTFIETFCNKADNNIWDKYNIRDTYFVVQCVIICCSVLLTVWSLITYCDENGVDYDCCCCCKKKKGKKHANDTLSSADKFDYYGTVAGHLGKTPRTKRKKVSDRATPEKDLWNRFHNVTREVSNNLAVPASPNTPIYEYDEISNGVIRSLYEEFCALRGTGEGGAVQYKINMFYDNSGQLKFTKSDIVDNNNANINDPDTVKGSSASSISHIYLSSENVTSEDSFKNIISKFTGKTVLQTMVESLDMSPLNLNLDGTVNSPLYVSKNWQTAERLIVIVPPHTSKYPGIWSMRNVLANGGLSYGSMLLLLEQCIEDGDGVIILNAADEYNMAPDILERDKLKSKHIRTNDNEDEDFETMEKNLEYQTKAIKKKLIVDIERILTIRGGNEIINFETLLDNLINIHGEKLIQEQGRAIRAMYYQNYIHINDDLQTRRNKVAWDILVQKSKAKYVTMLAHKSSYGCAIKAYRYAKHRLGQSYRLNICAFVNGSKQDYLSFRSYMNINPLSRSLNQMFVFDSETKQTPLITMFESHARYTNENLKVFRFLKKNNKNDELRLLDYIYNNLEDNILYMEDEEFMWYVKRN
jgi:hypothetical protein